jgi:hypothetical protein
MSETIRGHFSLQRRGVADAKIDLTDASQALREAIGSGGDVTTALSDATAAQADYDAALLDDDEGVCLICGTTFDVDPVDPQHIEIGLVGVINVYAGDIDDPGQWNFETTLGICETCKPDFKTRAAGAVLSHDTSKLTW